MKILFIRGGALGDFIVTLPTLRLLRQRWPDAHIEVLGHPQIAEIALNRYYLDAIRSVNHGPLSAFFIAACGTGPGVDGLHRRFRISCSPTSTIPTNFSSSTCSVASRPKSSPTPLRVPDDFGRPAAHHFAGIVESLGLALADDVASELFPSPADGDAAARVPYRVETRHAARRDSSRQRRRNEKNGRLNRGPSWAAACAPRGPNVTLLVVEGEADEVPAQFVLKACKDPAAPARPLAAAADSRCRAARDGAFSRPRFRRHASRRGFTARTCPSSRSSARPIPPYGHRRAPA